MVPFTLGQAFRQGLRLGNRRSGGLYVALRLKRPSPPGVCEGEAGIGCQSLFLEGNAARIHGQCQIDGPDVGASGGLGSRGQSLSIAVVPHRPPALSVLCRH
jgi:hypothetical protein